MKKELTNAFLQKMLFFFKKKQKKHTKVDEEKTQKESPAKVMLVKNCLKFTSAVEFRKVKKILVILYSVLPRTKTTKIVKASNINSAFKFFITPVG